MTAKPLKCACGFEAPLENFRDGMCKACRTRAYWKAYIAKPEVKAHKKAYYQRMKAKTDRGGCDGFIDSNA